MIITLLEKPIRKIAQNDEIIHKMGESMRKNIRLTHELDFTLQKY